MGSLDFASHHTSHKTSLFYISKKHKTMSNFRSLAFVCTAVSFAFISVAIYTDHWREQVIQGDGFLNSGGTSVNVQKNFEGIWNNCNWDATGMSHCYQQPYGKNYQNFREQLSLPKRFYVYRGLAIICLLANFAGLLLVLAGLPCMRLSEVKDKRNIVGAGCNGLAAVTALILLITFRIYEFESIGRSSTMGKGLYLLLGVIVFETVSTGLCIAARNHDDDIIEESYKYQQAQNSLVGGSIVKQTPYAASQPSSYI